MEASSDFWASAHKLPCIALVNFNQWYGFRLFFLGWDWSLGLARAKPRIFALNGAPEGGPGIGGMLPLLTPVWDGGDTSLAFDSDKPLAKGAGGGGTGGTGAELWDKEFFGGRLGAGNGGGGGAKDVLVELLECKGGGGGGGGLEVIAELLEVGGQETEDVVDEATTGGSGGGGGIETELLTMEDRERGGERGGGGGGGFGKEFLTEVDGDVTEKGVGEGGGGGGGGGGVENKFLAEEDGDIPESEGGWGGGEGAENEFLTEENVEDILENEGGGEGGGGIENELFTTKDWDVLGKEGGGGGGGGARVEVVDECLAMGDGDVSWKEGGREGASECKVFVTGVPASEFVGDVVDGSDNECSILPDVVSGCLERKDCVTFRVGRGGGGLTWVFWIILGCTNEARAEGGWYGSGGGVGDGVDTWLGCGVFIIFVTEGEVGAAGWDLFTCFVISWIYLSWSCNRAVIPRDEGALWYLDIGDPCEADDEVWGNLGEMIFGWAGCWRETCTSLGSFIFLNEFESRAGLTDGMNRFPWEMDARPPMLFDAFNFSCSLSFSRADSIIMLPFSAFRAVSKFSWMKFDGVRCWSMFTATSSFGSSQSTLLKISWTLANASIGRPSFSSMPGKSIETREVAASISEKRTFIHTKYINSIVFFFYIKKEIILLVKHGGQFHPNFKQNSACRIAGEPRRYLCSEFLGKQILRIPQDVDFITVKHQNVWPYKSCVEHDPKHHFFTLLITIQTNTLQHNITLNMAMDVNFYKFTICLQQHL